MFFGRVYVCGAVFCRAGHTRCIGLMAEEESNMAQQIKGERKSRGRGFASMDPKKQREIASKGGRAAHSLGTAHEWTSDEARKAGRKGGATSRQRIAVG